MSNIKKIAKGTAIYSLTSLLQKGVNFLLLPLFALFFSASDFGVLGTVLALTGFLDIFLVLGLNSAATKFYYEYKAKSPEKIPRMWANLYGLSLFSGLLVVATSFTFGRPLLQWLLKDIPFAPFFVYGILGSLCVAIFSIFTASLQAREESTRYGIYNLSFVILQVILTVCLVVCLNFRADGPLLAKGLTFGLFIFVFLWATRKEIVWKVDKKILGEVFLYALPIVIHLVGSWFQTALDRVVLNRTTNLETVGVFQVAVQIAFPLTAITGAAINALAPWMTRNIINNPDHFRSRMVAVSPFFFAVIAMGFLFFLEIAEWVILQMFGAKYHSAIPSLGFLIFGHFVQMYYFIFVQPLFVIKNGTQHIPKISLPAAAIQTATLFMLTPLLAALGCAISFSIGMMFMGIFSYYYSQKFFPIRWNYTIFFPAGAFFLFIVLRTFSPAHKWVWFLCSFLLLAFLMRPGLTKAKAFLKEVIS